MQPLSPDPAFAPSSTPSGGVHANKRPAADGPCCRYRHDPADLAAPVVGSPGDNRHDSTLSGINKTAAGDTDVNRNGLGGQRNGLDGTRNDSTSRVGSAGPDSSSRMIVAWRGNRGRASAAAVETVLLARLFRGRGEGMSRGATFGCGRVWQPRRDRRSSGSSPRVHFSSWARYAT